MVCSIKPTVSIDFFNHNFRFNRKTYRLQIWDSAGQERFKSLATTYLRNADCALIAFDVTTDIGSQTSTTAVEEFLENEWAGWLKLLNEVGSETHFAVAVGNKIDKGQRTIPRQVAEKKARQMGMQYVEVSARNGQNIDALFRTIIQHFEQVFSQSQFKDHSSRPKICSQKQLILGNCVPKFRSVNDEKTYRSPTHGVYNLGELSQTHAHDSSSTASFSEYNRNHCAC